MFFFTNSTEGTPVNVANGAETRQNVQNSRLAQDKEESETIILLFGVVAGFESG